MARQSISMGLGEAASGCDATEAAPPCDRENRRSGDPKTRGKSVQQIAYLIGSIIESLYKVYSYTMPKRTPVDARLFRSYRFTGFKVLRTMSS